MANIPKIQLNSNKAILFCIILQDEERAENVLAAVSGIFWWFYNPSIAFLVITAILIVACPCALAMTFRRLIPSFMIKPEPSHTTMALVPISPR